MNRRLSRENIIRKLIEVLKPLDYVHAFYEGGAAAFNRIDEWSDIDLYLVVDEGKAPEAFATVETALKTLSPLAQKLEMPQLPWPGVFQTFYRLKDASEYLLIDFAVVSITSPEKFLDPAIHGNVKFYFKRSDKIRIPRLNKAAFSRKMQERLVRLKARFDMFNVLVQKEINRGNNLEAIDLYHNLTLASLIETLRVKHNPIHYDFRIRYVHYELPSDVVSRLESLYFVRDDEDLQRKYHEAIKWFDETMSEMEQKFLT